MISRDVSITMNIKETTYAQVVERALTVEMAEQLINLDHASRCESKRAV